MMIFHGGSEDWEPRKSRRFTPGWLRRSEPWAALAAVALGIAAVAAFGGETGMSNGPRLTALSRELPDPVKTPGAVASTDVHDVCGKAGGLTYSKRHRLSQNETVKREVLSRYGVPWAARGTVEDDHDVPLCAGGSDAVANRWPQPREGKWTAGDKDKLETLTCQQVCTGGLLLKDGQARFLAPADWRQSFCAVFTDPRCPP
jgi:hypothetical protein